MNTIDLKAILKSRTPGLFDKYPSFISTLVVKVLGCILHINEANKFIVDNSEKQGLELIDALFDTLDFGYLLSNKDIEKIPAEGKLVCVANHPLGALDGLALLKVIGSVRRDVKIVANDVLLNIDNLKSVFLPVNIFGKVQRDQIKIIAQSLLNEEVIIFFPAAEVSRIGLRGIRDKSWHNGPLYFAKKYKTPILPVYIKGKNSLLFYWVSLIFKGFSTFLLGREVFLKRNKTITMKIGDPIPASVFKENIINSKVQTKLLRRHTYWLGAKRKPPIFKTEKTIIHPVNRKSIKAELAKADFLSMTSDGKKLYKVEWEQGQQIVREIARLREVTFRKVGEGTGLKYDFDKYDYHYKHIIVWDEDDLEIIGSYRLGVCREIMKKQGKEGIYNVSLFDFSPKFDVYWDQSVELGRSFIQEKYWRSNALDNIWQGIGTYLSTLPNINYLFGAVSISDYYSDQAKALIVYYYRKWFGVDQLVRSKNQYIMTRQLEKDCEQLLNADSAAEDFKNLRSTLKNYGYSVPILFRKYTELCETDGVKFLDFGVDTSFSNTVDGLVLLDLNKLKPNKRERYYKKILDESNPKQGLS
ncbi:lysophospholipid acyltransferase family protein [candidate division KSB1 bacterium]|nr:lysophospholipid acyltransferase family protein [candidate division KSB1 bacterium]